AVPRPRLHPLGQGVVEHHRHVGVLGLVAGHVLLELFLRVGHDREVLGRDAVALRAVAVPPEGDAPAAGFPSRQDDAARDTSGEVFLEDTAVYDLADQRCHTGLLRRLLVSGRVVRPAEDTLRAPAPVKAGFRLLDSRLWVGGRVARRVLERPLERVGGAGVDRAAALAQLVDDVAARV